MACGGALRAAYARLRSQPKTAEQVFREINWWTLGYIREALDELAKAGECRTTRKTDGTRAYKTG